MGLQARGLAEYIDLHGRLDTSVDIYHNWPAFFALSAWFGRVAGTRPLEYAAWAQVFFNACNLVLLRYVFGSLSRDLRLVWTAVFVFFSANWVAQDYYSPQAFAFTLSLGLCGVILHWLLIAPDRAWMARMLNRAAAFVARLGRRRRSSAGPEDEPAGSQRVGRRTAEHRHRAVRPDRHHPPAHPVHADRRSRRAHFLGVVRPRLLVVLFATAMALAYLLPRLDFIQRYYGCWGRLEPLQNVRTAAGPYGLAGEPGRVLSAHAARLLSFTIWGWASSGWSAGSAPATRTWASPPWRPRPPSSSSPRPTAARRSTVSTCSRCPGSRCSPPALRPGGDDWSSARAVARLLLPLALLLGLFLPAYFGMAATNVRLGKVAASQYFYDHAPPHFSCAHDRRTSVPGSPGRQLRPVPPTIGETHQPAHGEAVAAAQMLGDRHEPVIAQVMRNYGGGQPVYLAVSRNGKVTSQILHLLPRGCSTSWSGPCRDPGTSVSGIATPTPRSSNWCRRAPGDPSNGATSR